MSEYCSNFLENEFPYIASNCYKSEKHLVEMDYNNSIIESLISINDILIRICKLHHFDKLLSQTPIFINDFLFNNGFTTSLFFESVKQAFDIQNNFINDSNNKITKNNKTFALKLHKLLFDISVSFYRSEIDSNFKFPKYNGPIYNKLNNDNSNKNTHDINDGLSENNETSADINLNIKDSKLLNQLLKLRDSSKEAVEFDDNFSDFKNYMHVNRSIQKDFIDELKRIENEDSNHLVMLCGSVGDGKSHMLAYVKTHYPDLFNKFIVHNDATESFDPDKDAIDTLVKVLEPFNNNNFNSSSDKIILAINLGILNKFLESDYCNNDFSILKGVIEKANIFDNNIISKNIIQDKVSFITFSDYNLFELSEEGTSSKYISSLFNKITLKSDENPFYNAYLEDKKLGYKNIIMFNYEMLMDKNVQDIIIQYIIKLFIKYKKILSTRDLLNFIYEIIVPPVEINGEDSDFSSFKYIVPNLLFNNYKRSDILKLFSNFDPTLIRNEELDEFIINIHVNDDLYEILNKYFETDKITFLEPYFDKINKLFKDKKDKSEIITILIRLLLFYGTPSIKLKFKDEYYDKFIKYLYYYNLQSHNKYKKLFSEIKNAMFYWKGSFRKNYICIDELNSFNIYKYLNLKNKVDKWDNNLLNGLDLDNRFKTEIKIFFSIPQNDNKYELNIDFQLYEYISKLNMGFKPNSNEKEDLLIFDDFIDLLIENNVNNNLIIKSLDDNLDFSFEYDADFESFEFKRV